MTYVVLSIGSGQRKRPTHVRQSYSPPAGAASVFLIAHSPPLVVHMSSRYTSLCLGTEPRITLAVKALVAICLTRRICLRMTITICRTRMTTRTTRTTKRRRTTRTRARRQMMEKREVREAREVREVRWRMRERVPRSLARRAWDQPVRLDRPQMTPSSSIESLQPPYLHSAMKHRNLLDGCQCYLRDCRWDYAHDQRALCTWYSLDLQTASTESPMTTQA
mmetsp:Transcript_27652/g.70475  ORF Transcript_27652/g.70475 Transcript_27652/m.70475 type:complete len:221 (-) Transcript_27652:532-1194(-)